MKDSVTTRAQLLEEAGNRNVVKFIDSAVRISIEQLPELHTEALRLTLLIYRISASLNYDLESSVHRPAGVSSPGFHLLWVLWLTGSLEASAVATMMGESRATVSNISATLEKAGLLVKTPSPTDGRSVLLNLSKAGRKQFESIFKAEDERHLQWYNCLTKAESEKLISLLSKLADKSKEIARPKA